MSVQGGASLSAGALKRAAVLAALARFDSGSYGEKRLQKVIYHASRSSHKKPFRYRFWLHGEYSSDVSETLKALAADGLVEISPLDAGIGKKLSLTDAGKLLVKCLAPVERVLPGFAAGLTEAMHEVGYRRDSEINTWAKSQPEVKGKARGDVLFRDDLEASTDVPDMSEEEAADLELALCTSFIRSTGRVIETLRGASADFSILHEWDGTATASSSRPQ